jgi:hypothetical protein
MTLRQETIMEKRIAQVSYWLGVVCLLIAVIWRIVAAFGRFDSLMVVPGHNIRYMSFFDGSILFFVATLATVSYAWLKARTP